MDRNSFSKSVNQKKCFRTFRCKGTHTANKDQLNVSSQYYSSETQQKKIRTKGKNDFLCDIDSLSQ